MLHTDSVFKVAVLDALGWGLYKKSLLDELTDRAEQKAIEQSVTVDEIPIAEADCEAKITIEVFEPVKCEPPTPAIPHFVVRFKNWRDELHTGDEIKIDTCFGKNTYGPRTVTIQTIKFNGIFTEILTKDGEKIECLRKEIV